MIICLSTKNKVIISSNFVFGISYDVEVGVCERDSLYDTGIIMPPQNFYAATMINHYKFNISEKKLLAAFRSFIGILSSFKN